MITEKNYNNISKKVYDLDPVKYPELEKQLKIDDTFLSSGQRFVVLQAEGNSLNPTDNGMQAMAVAPVKGYDVEGKLIVDTSQIVIAYAGTNIKDSKDIDTDVQMIAGGNTTTLKTDYETVRVPGTTQTVRLPQTQTDSQLKTAQKFYEDIRKKYPEANLTTTGHSLGAYLAIIVAAENQIPSIAFNGPDPVRGMSDSAIKWVEENRNLYTNYRIEWDVVGNIGAYGDKHFKTDNLGISINLKAKRLRKISFDSILEGGFYWHSLSAYDFNEYGRIVDRDGNVVNNRFLASTQYQTVLTASSSMAQLKEFASQSSLLGTASGEIFLDAGQGYILGASMAEAAKSGLDEMTALKTKADAEVEAIWSKVDFSIYSELSAWEVRDIFASHGVTHQEIVSDFHDYTQKKVKKMEKLSTAFDTLKTKLDEAVESKKALDGKLAGEFSAWHESL
ncbi:TPA: hypothetical protein TZ704_001981 [Streptococcus suis]|nr:hypothetical protein [Streptococcus suis]